MNKRFDIHLPGMFLFQSFVQKTGYMDVLCIRFTLSSQDVSGFATDSSCSVKWQGLINCTQGAVSVRKTVLPGMAIPMLKIRRPNGRLIFNMEIAIRR